MAQHSLFSHAHTQQVPSFASPGVNDLIDAHTPLPGNLDTDGNIEKTTSFIHLPGVFSSGNLRNRNLLASNDTDDSYEQLRMAKSQSFKTLKNCVCPSVPDKCYSPNIVTRPVDHTPWVTFDNTAHGTIGISRTQPFSFFPATPAVHCTRGDGDSLLSPEAQASVLHHRQDHRGCSGKATACCSFHRSTTTWPR